MYIRTTAVICVRTEQIIYVKELRNQFSGVNCCNTQVLRYQGKWRIGNLSENYRTQELFISHLWAIKFKTRKSAEKHLIKVYGNH